MKYNSKTLLFIFVILLLSCSFLSAQQQYFRGISERYLQIDQIEHPTTYYYVLNIGTLGHSFVEIDETRENTGLTEEKDEIRSIFGLQASFEFYPSRSFGFGYLYQNIPREVEYDFLDGSELTRKFNLINQLLTITFLRSIWGKKYFKFGFIGGYGISEYKYTLEGSRSNCTICGSGHSNGTVILIGSFLGLGKSKFGGRLGINGINTNHKDMEYNTNNELSINTSGYQIYLNLKYDF